MYPTAEWSVFCNIKTIFCQNLLDSLQVLYSLSWVFLIYSITCPKFLISVNVMLVICYLDMGSTVFEFICLTFVLIVLADFPSLMKHSGFLWLWLWNYQDLYMLAFIELPSQFHFHAIFILMSVIRKWYEVLY